MSSYRYLSFVAALSLGGCGGAEDARIIASSGDDGGAPPESGPTSVSDASVSDATIDAGLEAGTDAISDTGLVDSSTGPCPSGQILCGATCVQSASDPNNCGSCGHGCLGSTCSAQRCDPIVIATGQGTAMAMAADGTNVFWSGASTKRIIAKQARDGAVNSYGVMATLLETINLIQPHGATLFFGGAALGFYSTPIAGGTVTTLPFDAPVAFAVDPTATHIYEVSAGIYDCWTDGRARPCDPVAAVTDHDSTDSIALVGDNLFWPDVQTSIVYRWSRSAGTIENFATGQQAASALRTDGQNLYWTAYVSPHIQIFRAPGAGIPAPTSLANINGLSDMVVDTKIVVYIEDGVIKAIPATGGAAVFVAQSYSPRSLAMDDVAIYWTDQDGSIRKVARP